MPGTSLAAAGWCWEKGAPNEMEALLLAHVDEKRKRKKKDADRDETQTLHLTWLSQGRYVKCRLHAHANYAYQAVPQIHSQGRVNFGSGSFFCRSSFIYTEHCCYFLLGFCMYVCGSCMMSFCKEKEKYQKKKRVKGKLKKCE